MASSCITVAITGSLPTQKVDARAVDALVKRVADLCGEYGRRVATANEARAPLRLA